MATHPLSGINDGASQSTLIPNEYTRVFAPRSLAKEEKCSKKQQFVNLRFLDPTGTQSCPAKVGHQPEPSVAWGVATRTAKRTQGVHELSY